MQLSCEEDRIGKLPDDILADILSILTIKQAAQTSVLSHRWLNLWMHVPLLYFDDAKERLPLETRTKEMCSYVNRVNHILQCHRRSSLRDFMICFDLDKGYQNEIDKWVKYAFAKRVMSLELNLNPVGRLHESYMDNFVFHTQLLDQASPCGMHIAGKVNCLKILHFQSVNVSGEAVECLLRKCPLLEELHIIKSGDLTGVVVSGPSLLLKHLVIRGCAFESVTISDINLVSLSLGIPERKKTRGLPLRKVPMLTEVRISGLFHDFEGVIFSYLSCCLSQLTVLTIQALSPKTIMNLHKFPELRNLRRLVLMLSCRDQCLIGLTSWINACPRLLEFSLMHGLGSHFQLPYMGEKKAKEESLRCLKVMELHGYKGDKNEIELVTFFINNATVGLEKIVIDPHGISYGCIEVREIDASEDDRVQTTRRHAIEELGGLVPQHVQLSIL